ncbi:MAG: trypsin-like peptidase domain-containing protein [Alphaproteobacteria bacterium]
MNRLLLAAVMLIGTAFPTRADFDAGAAAFVRGDFGQAIEELRPLAAGGDVMAQTALGIIYDAQRDYEAAVKWYAPAAKAGFAPAEWLLGTMYDDGQGVSENNGEATRLYGRAAKQGYVRAQYYLALMYLAGEGVPENDEQFLKWLRLAAQGGEAYAQEVLGTVYHLGDMLSQNHAEAARWYRKAAEQGNPSAQASLGRLYEEGTGAPRDFARAVEWYRLGAAQGDATGQMALGRMYRDGRGVPRDLAEAYFWFNLAVVEPAVEESATLARDAIAVHLTSDQLAAAKARMKRWQPEPSVLGAQHRLTVLGYNPGPIDGIVGSRTRAAIGSFQTAHGLPATGRLSEELESQLLRAEILMELSTATNRLDRETAKAAPQAPPRARGATPAAEAPENAGTGSGFVLNGDGDVLTNRHVVRGCRQVRVVHPTGQKVVATRIREDNAQDLAIVETPLGNTSHASFRGGRGIRLGEEVVAMGYPLYGLLAENVSATTGTVSNLAGIGDDRSLVQITAPVQPGNSGGPLLDRSGNVVGIIVGKLDALAVADITGDIPQNVNFAINAGIARLFLDLEGVEYDTAPSDRPLEAADIAARAREFTVLIECFE